ncbi:autotransporter family protein [Bartonella harrusi]|uniref:Autotransporter outer membrane beta-barrel domain-containing protein n=1 Tax=Bartonella harrusi TaxID=2961895 RepID=A0ABY5EV22_9HYPH|nr:autotransporter outer membrane beta-barrel domain-containing protein [Bartonella harrusi]UTO28001.1 autotransporter outer membrane beta-barrel domain-containing protein [Bartonella harrusi]
MIIKISKNHLYSCVFIGIVFSVLSNIKGVEARSRSSMSLSCNEGKLPYRCSDGMRHTISDQMYQFRISSEAMNGNGHSFMSSAAIGAQKPNTIIQAMRVKVEGTDNKEDTYGVIASQGGKVVLSNSVFKGFATGLKAESGMIEGKRGEIEATQVGVYAEKQGASVVLKDTKIKVEGQDIGQRTALFSGVDADIKMMGGSIDVRDAAALYVGTNGKAALEGVTITSKGRKTNEEDDIAYAVLNINQLGSISLKNTNVVATDVNALWIGLDANAQLKRGQEGNILISRVSIEDSKITLMGNKIGIHFDMEQENNDNEKGIVLLKKAIFEVPDGTAIHSYKSSGYIGVSEGTKISGDLLLKAEKKASLALLANSSSLIGGARVADDSLAELYLTGNSKWVLTKRKAVNLQDSERIISSISFVKLADSIIIFETPTSQEYQMLRIGNGKEEVYSAQGDAHLYLNTFLNHDGSLNDQKTDRLLIHGDVSGKTTIHVQFIAGNKGSEAGNENTHSVSLIQVSGKAAEDSFQLNSPYITWGGLPYQYYLHAYGPSSSLGNARTDQRLVEGHANFWDFRLESKYIQPVPEELVEPKIREVVPQIPTYLLLQNALFHAGLVDIVNQNKRLEIMRSVSREFLETNKDFALSVQGYGGSYRYVSDLSALEYGYGGNLDYNAIEAGIALKMIESAYNKTSLGILGTYGKLSLHPRDVEQSQKSVFHKWSVTAYGRIEHDTGFYANGLLSYGLFKGNVFTVARGKTATLKGTPLNVSLSVGKAFMIGDWGLVLDPQAQLIYQHLQFDNARDIDHFDIEIGKSDQWVMRVGGHLTKTLAISQEDRLTSFYGKLHFTHSFAKKQFVRFKDAFPLGSFGSSLETGFGIYSKLSSKIALHGDLIYQHKLTKGGFSGIRFSGGLRYSF